MTYVEKHAAELAKATQDAITKHRKEILNRQLVVERLADMAMELYARTTTLARTQRLIDEHGAAACAREIALTELFCLQSGRRFRAHHAELDGSVGATIDDSSQRRPAGAHRWRVCVGGRVARCRGAAVADVEPGA